MFPLIVVVQLTQKAPAKGMFAYVKYIKNIFVDSEKILCYSSRV